MLTKEFVSLCKKYSESRTNVIFTNVQDTKKHCIYTIELYNCVLEFVYVKKETIYIKPSSLYCTIKLNKNSIVHYQLPDIIPFLNSSHIKSCYFWYIENPERLENCFLSLTSTLEYILSELDFVHLDNSKILNTLFQSYVSIFSLKEKDIDFNKIDDPTDYSQNFFLSMQKMRDEFIFSRFSNFTPYKLLLENKFEKALAKYEKLNQKNQLLEYEKQLIAHINNEKPEKFEVFDPSCDTSLINKMNTPLAGIREFAITFILFSFLFCTGFAIFNAVISINTLLVLSTPWYLGMLCSALCSVFGAVAWVTYMPLPNKYLTKKQRKDFSKTVVSKGVKRFALVAFLLSIVVSIFFAVMILVENVRFYDDCIRFDNTSHKYSDIYRVYHISARYNEFGGRVERSSYVILFTDKTSLDLDGYTTIEFTEKEILPLLKEKGFKINTVDSERDLPWYTEQD